MAPSERLGIALAGTGRIAERHARAIAACAGAELVAVLSRRRERAERLARAHGARAETDPGRLLDDARVAALVIATEHDRHLPLIEAAAARGRHVLVEKPLATSLDDGRRAVAACERAGVVLGTVFQWRFHPHLAALRGWAREGRLGRPLLAEVSLAWRRDGAYFEKSPWRADPARSGGGVVMMQAVHLLDLLRFVLGDVREVSGLTATVRGASGGVEDSAVIGLRFASGALGSVVATTAACEPLGDRVAFHFADGSVVHDAGRMRGTGAGARRGLGARLGAAGGILRALFGGGAAAGRGALFAAVHRDFVAAVRERRPPRTAGRDSLASLELVLAVYRAAREARTVQLGGETSSEC